MATTTPDNIRTPSPSDPYNLVADLAILGSDVQTALNRRANAYRGTSAQRTAFTSAEDGVIWVDTTGSMRVWQRSGGEWVALNALADSGALALSFSGSWTTPVPASVRVVGKCVSLQGSIQHNTFSGGFTKIGSLPASVPAPTRELTWPLSANSGVPTTLRIQTNKDISVWRESASSAWWSLAACTYYA